MEDPIVEEIHRYREEWAAQFNYDIHAMVEDLRRRQQAENRTVVTLPPKRVAVAPVTTEPEAEASLAPFELQPV